MTPLARLLDEEIRRQGPLPFSRFMEAALYHPVYGYYRRAADPFGSDGDFYTAAQFQPVFGALIQSAVHKLWRDAGQPDGFTVVELGAGRGEMADAFSPWRYVPVDWRQREWPISFHGLVFANEFFDALPVDVLRYRGGVWREMRVASACGAFQWQEYGAARADLASLAARCAGEELENRLVEVNTAALRWLEEIARRLSRGYVLIIDYGYTSRELLRFPEGTLMSYRRHTASSEVLRDPGERDITAHVNFTALAAQAIKCGFHAAPLQTLTSFLLGVGSQDNFAHVLAADDPRQQLRLRMQLKSLLFGMGETFRVLLLSKAVHQRAQGEQ